MIKIILFTLFFCFSLYSQESVFLETNDSWKIHSKYLKPKKENLPVLLLVHSNKSNYTEWKKWFNEIERFGYGWLSIELRGHGVSTYRADGSTQTFSSFQVSGFDNDYNKMIRDIDAAVIYLSSVGIREQNIILIGINLGANLAIKYSAINKNIMGCIAINPSTNINDILTINALRLYGERPILFVTAQNNKKRLQEVMLLYNITKKISGTRNTFIITEYSIKSADDVLKSAIYRILTWIKNPTLPEIVDINTINKSTGIIISSSTAPSYIIIENED